MSAMSPAQRIEFSSIEKRAPLPAPEGARVILWPVFALEVWDIARAMARTVLPSQLTKRPSGRRFLGPSRDDRTLGDPMRPMRPQASQTPRLLWWDMDCGSQYKGA